MQKFSANLANWYSVTESAANLDIDDSEPGPWLNLRTMFQYKGKTEDSVTFSCLLCVPKKSVSAFSNLPSNLRKHVEVSKNRILLSCPSRVILLHGF